MEPGPYWEPPPEPPPPIPGPWPPPPVAYTQTFGGGLLGEAWGAATPEGGGRGEGAPPPPYLPFGGGPPLEEPPPACLYQDLQPPPCAPPGAFQGPALQGLGGGDGFVGPPWAPDGARCPQDPERYPPFAAFPPWPALGGCELGPPWVGGAAPPEVPPAPPPSQSRPSPPYRSRLSLGGGPPRYRPPPMLDPGRSGPGLFGGLSSTGGARSPPGSPDPLRLKAPQINVGSGFQAAVPELGGCARSPPTPGGATLAWSPWPGLEGDPTTQRQVEMLLALSCSSAVPGGGTNTELALHCLARASGSLTGALELLLLGTPAWPEAHPLAGYHYAGSDSWSPRERRLFAQALARHGKDFGRIQRAVPSKRTTQCVEFYYLHKARMGRGRRQVVPEGLGARFPCKLCGKIFPKIKSRNAHMKIHRQQDDWGGASPLILPPPWAPALGGALTAVPPPAAASPPPWGGGPGWAGPPPDTAKAGGGGFIAEEGGGAGGAPCEGGVRGGRNLKLPPHK
nr:transcriptional-regulating factor 1-like [Anas platyrhynchos]